MPTGSPGPEQPGHGPIQAMLSRAARELGLWVVGGTLPWPPRPARVPGTTLMFNPQGRCAARYDKIHCSALTMAARRYDESRRAGARP